MRTLKKIILVLLAIPIILLLIALMVQKDYAVERSIEINRPKQAVFDYVKYLKNQDNFSKWANMDPDMVKTYRGTDGQAGFVSAWKSDNKDVGAGEQEIILIEPGSRIDYELRFIEPFESTENAYIITTAVDSTKTEVKWGFNGRMDYPMNLMLLFMDFEEMIGGDLQTGLENLKAQLE